MDLSRTVSEINGNFCGKSQISQLPVCITSLLREFPLEFCHGGSTGKNLPLPDGGNFDDVRIHVDIIIPQCDGQTDAFALTVSCSACIGMLRRDNESKL